MAPISHMRKLRLKKWAKRENQVLLTPECSLYIWIATSRPRLGQRDKLSEKQRLFERPRSRINFTDEETASVTSPRLRGQQRQLECQAPSLRSRRPLAARLWVGVACPRPAPFHLPLPRAWCQPGSSIGAREWG